MFNFVWNCKLQLPTIFEYVVRALSFCQLLEGVQVEFPEVVGISHYEKL